MLYCALPLTLPRQLDAHHVLADEAELLRLLQLALGDLRRLGRDFGKGGDLAVGQPPPGLLVDDDVRPGRQLGDRHVPVLGGVRQQHLAHLRAELAQRLEVGGHRIAAGGVHVAEARILVELVVRRRRRRRAPSPSRRRAPRRGCSGSEVKRALPHLGRRRHDRDRAVGRDRHPRAQRLAGARAPRDGARRAASPIATAKVRPAAPTMKSRRDGAASDVRSMWMVMAQPSRAARSMARTMRG